MKLVYTLLAGLLMAGSTHAQSLKKYAVSSSGASAYFFCDPGKFNESRTPDSSDVYTAECMNDNTNYGIICVRMKGRISDLQKSEEVLMSYLDYLKTSFKITKSIGYGKGHTLRNNDKTRGVLDYWEDSEKASWKIKGWTDGKYIVFMYINTPGTLNETKGNIFLDGLVLPAS